MTSIEPWKRNVISNKDNFCLTVKYFLLKLAIVPKSTLFRGFTVVTNQVTMIHDKEIIYS